MVNSHFKKTSMKLRHGYKLHGYRVIYPIRLCGLTSAGTWSGTCETGLLHLPSIVSGDRKQSETHDDCCLPRFYSKLRTIGLWIRCCFASRVTLMSFYVTFICIAILLGVEAAKKTLCEIYYDLEFFSFCLLYYDF